MSKKPGDMARATHQNLQQMLGGLAKELKKSDDRFERFWNYKPVPKFMSWFASDKKVKFACGGNKSTKSFAGIFECIMIYTGMIPPSMVGVYPHTIPTNRPRKVRIILMNYSKHWPEVIKPILLSSDKGMLPEAWANFNEDQHIFYGPDGSQLSIMACDPHEEIDPAVLRGPEIDHTMIDEVNTEPVFTESLTRGVSLQDGPKTISLTYCPQNGRLSWEYEALYKRVFDPITGEYLREQPKDIYGIRVTMHDNPSISQEEREKIIGTLKPWEVAFRVNGEYSEKSSNPYFNMDQLIEWQNDMGQYKEKSFVVEEKVVDVERGIFDGEIREARYNDEDVWKVWEEAKEGEKYVLSVDIGSGTIGGDPSCADLWRCTEQHKPVQVAQLHSDRLKPGVLASQCGCMSNVYGDCLIVPEMNNYGMIFVDRLRNHKNLYRRVVDMNKQVSQDSEELGWFTNRKTKPLVLEGLYKFMGECRAGKFCPIRAHATLTDLMSFEERAFRDRFDRFIRMDWSAKTGFHDDCVISMAIGLRIIFHEYYKVTKCKFAKGRKKLLTDGETHETVETNEAGSFSYMRKKVPALHVLKNRLYGVSNSGRPNQKDTRQMDSFPRSLH